MIQHRRMGWARRGAIVALLVAGSLPARAEAPGITNLIARAPALAAARAVTADQFPDADAVLVSGWQRMAYQPDGTYDHREECYVKILTEKARRAQSTLSTYFTIPYQRGPEDCVVEQVEIIRPDGAARAVDVAAASRLVTDTGSMDMNIYNPNDKVIQVGIADLQVGDVLHYQLYDRIVKPRMENTWYDWITLEGETPIVVEVVEIVAPTSCPLRAVALKDPVPGTVTATVSQAGAETVHRWEARNVPRMFPEPNMPAAYTVAQRLLVSTAPDWAGVSRWYWNLSAPHLVVTPEMQARVAALTNGLADAHAQQDALFRFVARDIRYLGLTLETAAPGYEPHDAAATLAARHGVCRDKAALLVALLRAAGWDAFPALIHNGPRKDPEVPQPYFNHAIVALRTAPGEYALMDPTDENSTAWLPAYLNHKSYLVATPEGDPLRTSPIDPAEHNLMRVATTARLNADGRLAAETTLQFAGINDGAYRDWLIRRKPEERQRFFEGLVKKAMPAARLKHAAWEPRDLADMSRPLEMRLAFEAPDVLLAGRGSAALPLPAFGPHVGMVNFIIGETGLSERKYPLMTEMACGVEETVAIELPSSWPPAAYLPSAVPRDSAAVHWSLGSTQVGARVETAARFLLKVVEFSPEQYRDLNATLAQIDRDLRKMPVFTRPAGGPGGALAEDADAMTLDEQVVYRVAAADAWTETRRVTRRLLTYAGLKNNGELKLDYNPAWETLTLQAARVITPDGAVHLADTQEVNRMDAPWAGSAPRYPAAQTLVVSFPALVEGCVVEYAYERACSNRPFFALHEDFQGMDPLARKSVQVRRPADLPLAVFAAQRERLEWQEETSGGTLVSTWTITNAAAVRAEESLPPLYTFGPAIFASAGTWPAYVQQARTALAAAAAGQTGVVARARDLLAGVTNPADQVVAVRDFVARQVRPAGPDWTALPLDCLAPADQTLREGYGHNADRAVLLAALLAAAGLVPEWVPVADCPALEALRKPYAQAPDPGLFSNLLVRVPVPGRGPIYLNDTDQYAALGACEHAGCLGLDLAAGGFVEIQPELADGRLVRHSLSVDMDGNAHLETTRLVQGAEFGREHKQWAERTPENRRRAFRELVDEVAQSAQADGDLITDFSSYPGRLQYAVTIPGYAAVEDQYLVLPLPPLWPDFLRLGLDRRCHPLYMRQTRADETLLDVFLPPGFVMEYQPPDRAWEAVAAAPVAAAMESRLVPNRGGSGNLRVRATGARRPAIVPPDQYPAALDFAQELVSPSLGTVILRARVKDDPAGGAPPPGAP